MKPFQFRLESIRQLRAYETLLAQQAVAEAEEQAQRARESFDHASAERMRCLRLAQAVRMSSCTVADLRAFAHELDRLSQLEQAAGMRYQNALRTLRERRQQLAEARKQEKVMDKLRERQEEAYRAEIQQAERAFLDEVGTQRYCLGKGARLP